MIPNKKRLLTSVQKIRFSRQDLSSYFKEVYSAIEVEIPFDAGCFFEIDPETLLAVETSEKIWVGVPPIGNKGIDVYPSPPIFSSIRSLLQKKTLCVRGKERGLPPISRQGKYHFSLIVFLLDEDKKCRGEVILWREKGGEDFSDDEVDALAFISSAIGSKLKKTDSNENISLFSKIGEEELHTLVRRRAQPGILILNQQGKIEYVNHDAKNLLESLLIKEASLSSRRTSLPEMIDQLYIQFEEIIRYPYDETIQSGMPTINRVCVHEGIVFLFRALLLQKQGAKGDTTHILILIEKVSRGVRVDQLIKSAPLTKREQAVVRFLLEGKTNKEVVSSLDIGEYTVKDHVKRIMKKLNVTTRAGIVARVLHQHSPS